MALRELGMYCYGVKRQWLMQRHKYNIEYNTGTYYVNNHGLN